MVNKKLIFENDIFKITMNDFLMNEFENFKSTDIFFLKETVEYINNNKANSIKKVDDFLEEIRTIFDFEGYLFKSDTIRMYNKLFEDGTIEQVIEEAEIELGEPDTDEYIDNVVYSYWQSIGDEEFGIFEDNIIVEYK